MANWENGLYNGEYLTVAAVASCVMTIAKVVIYVANIRDMI